jgi:hypothetical protein
MQIICWNFNSCGTNSHYSNVLLIFYAIHFCILRNLKFKILSKLHNNLLVSVNTCGRILTLLIQNIESSYTLSRNVIILISSLRSLKVLSLQFIHYYRYIWKYNIVCVRFTMYLIFSSFPFLIIQFVIVFIYFSFNLSCGTYNNAESICSIMNGKFWILPFSIRLVF